MNLNYLTQSDSDTMVFRFNFRHFLVFSSLFFLSLGTGCSQQRYKPAKWRAAQRNSESKKDRVPHVDTGSWDGGPNSGAATDRNMGTMPIRGGGTLPGRGWGTLPNRGAGSTMPSREFERGSTLPQRRWQVPARGNSTLPQRRWQPQPRRGTMPRRRYEEIKHRVPAEVAEVGQPELSQLEPSKSRLRQPERKWNVLSPIRSSAGAGTTGVAQTKEDIPRNPLR